MQRQTETCGQNQLLIQPVNLVEQNVNAGHSDPKKIRERQNMLERNRMVSAVSDSDVGLWRANVSVFVLQRCKTWLAINRNSSFEYVDPTNSI